MIDFAEKLSELLFPSCCDLKKEKQNNIMRVISNVLLVFPFKTSQINSARQGFSLICLSLADMKEEIFFSRKACPKTFSQNP